MTKIDLVLEGQSERDFVTRLLGPYIQEKTSGDVVLVPRVLITSIGARTHRGGGTNKYAKIREDVRKCFLGSADWYSSMLDLFQFPIDAPFWGPSRPTDPLTWVAQMEKGFAADINNWRFRPYISLHEFEALLLTDPAAIVAEVESMNPHLDEMRQLISSKSSPEYVNDGPKTAPSKRLCQWSSGAYSKTLHGPAILQSIGIDAMRRACPHFNAWVAWLLAPSASG